MNNNVSTSGFEFNPEDLFVETKHQIYIMIFSMTSVCIFMLWLLDVMREHQTNSKLHTLENTLTETQSQLVCANQVLKRKTEELEQKCAEMEAYTKQNLISLASRSEMKVAKIKYDLEGFMELVDARMKKCMRGHNDITQTIYTLENTINAKLVEMDTQTVLGLRDMEQKLKGIQSEKTGVNILLQKLHQDHQTLFAKYAVLNNKTDELKKNTESEYIFIGVFSFNQVAVPILVPKTISSLKKLFEYKNIMQYWLLRNNREAVVELKLLAQTNITRIDFEDMYIVGSCTITFILDDGSCVETHSNMFTKDMYEHGGESHIACWTNIHMRNQELEKVKCLKTELNKYGITLVLMKCVEDLMK